MIQSLNKTHVWRLIIALTLITLLLANIDGWWNNDDEGTALYATWRVALGEQPYTDFTTTKAPLFLSLGGLAVKLLGRNLFLLRASMALTVLLGTTFFAWSIKQLWNEKAAWLVWTTTLLAPQFFAIARVFRADSLMLAFVLVGLGCLILEVKYEKRWLLALGGFFFGLGLLAKAIGVMPMFGAGLWLLIRMGHHRQWRRGIIDGVLLTAVALTTVAGGYLLSEALYPGTLDMVLGAQNSTTDIIPIPSPLPYCSGEPSNNVFLCRVIKGSVAWLGVYYNNWTLIFALTPFILLIRYARKPNPLWIFGAQIIGSLPIYLLSGPVYPRYLIYAIPSLVAIWWLSVTEFDLPRFPQLSQATFLIPALLYPLLFAWPAQVLLTAQEHDTAALASWIDNNTPPDAIVLSDYAEIPFHAGRQSLPSQGGIGQGWAMSGLMTGAQLQTELEATQAHMVLLHIPEDPEGPAHMYYLRDFDEFYAYLAENYRLERVWLRTEQPIEIWVRP